MMSIEDILMLARDGMELRMKQYPLQIAVVELLSIPSCVFPRVTPDLKLGTIHVPRDANRSYTPQQARELALLLLRSADAVDRARPRPIESAATDPVVYYESAAAARVAASQRQALLDAMGRAETSEPPAPPSAPEPPPAPQATAAPMPPAPPSAPAAPDADADDAVTADERPAAPRARTKRRG